MSEVVSTPHARKAGNTSQSVISGAEARKAGGHTNPAAQPRFQDLKTRGPISVPHAPPQHAKLLYALVSAIPDDIAACQLPQQSPEDHACEGKGGHAAHRHSTGVQQPAWALLPPENPAETVPAAPAMQPGAQCSTSNANTPHQFASPAHHSARGPMDAAQQPHRTLCTTQQQAPPHAQQQPAWRLRDSSTPTAAGQPAALVAFSLLQPSVTYPQGVTLLQAGVPASEGAVVLHPATWDAVVAGARHTGVARGRQAVNRQGMLAGSGPGLCATPNRPQSASAVGALQARGGVHSQRPGSAGSSSHGPPAPGVSTQALYSAGDTRQGQGGKAVAGEGRKLCVGCFRAWNATAVQQAGKAHGGGSGRLYSYVRLVRLVPLDIAEQGVVEQQLEVVTTSQGGLGHSNGAALAAWPGLGCQSQQGMAWGVGIGTGGKANGAARVVSVAEYAASIAAAEQSVQVATAPQSTDTSAPRGRGTTLLQATGTATPSTVQDMQPRTRRGHAQLDVTVGGSSAQMQPYASQMTKAAPGGKAVSTPAAAGGVAAYRAFHRRHQRGGANVWVAGGDTPVPDSNRPAASQQLEQQVTAMEDLLAWARGV